MSILLAIGADIDARLAAHLLAPLQQPVVIAHTAAEVERFVRAHSFAVAIIDTDSLDGGGLDLVRGLMKAGFDGFTIVVNPSADVMDKVEALQAGADDYLVYPYEPAELIARVQAALRRRHQRERGAEGGIVRVGAVQLDVNELEVSAPDKRHVHLTPNEMRLLLYLMTHTQRAVDQRELLEHLFGAGAGQVASNAVGVYIRRVRRKIERNPDQPSYVVTVRGHGYQFRATEEDGAPMLSAPPALPMSLAPPTSS